MEQLLLVLAIILAIGVLIPFYRVIVGPTVYDRILGAGIIGTKTIVLIALLGFLFGRIEMFIDIALAYALLNFIGVIAIAKYFDRKGEQG